MFGTVKNLKCTILYSTPWYMIKTNDSIIQLGGVQGTAMHSTFFSPVLLGLPALLRLCAAAMAAAGAGMTLVASYSRD